LKAERSAQILGGLSLASTCRTSRSGTHGQIQCLSKGNVAAISQVCDNKPTAVADVFVVVVGLPVANPDHADFAVLLNALVLFEVEAQLLLPLERLHVGDLFLDKVRNDITLLHIDSNDRDNLDT
jgi:hypothetical protein